MKRSDLEKIINQCSAKPIAEAGGFLSYLFKKSEDPMLRLLRQTLSIINKAHPDTEKDVDINAYYQGFHKKLSASKLIPELKVSLFVIKWEIDAGLGSQAHASKEGFKRVGLSSKM